MLSLPSRPIASRGTPRGLVKVLVTAMIAWGTLAGRPALAVRAMGAVEASQTVRWTWNGEQLWVFTAPAPERVTFRNRQGEMLAQAAFVADGLGGLVALLERPTPEVSLRAELLGPGGTSLGELWLPPQAVEDEDSKAAEATGGVVRWSGGGQADPSIRKQQLWTEIARRGRALLQQAHREPARFRMYAEALKRPPVKDEFESSAAFMKRAEAYNERVRRFNAARAEVSSDAPTRLTSAQWARIARDVLTGMAPSPVVTGFRYDADAERVFLTLGPETFLKDMGLPTLVTVSLPPDRARQLKTNLETLAPVWTFRIDDHGGLQLTRIELEDRDGLLTLAPADAAALAQVTPLPDVRLERIANPKAPQGTLPLLQVPDTIGQDPDLQRLTRQLADLQRRQREVRQTAVQRKTLEDQIRLAQDKLRQMQRTDAGADDLPARLAQAPAAQPDPHRHMIAIGISDYRALAPVPFASEAAQVMKTTGNRLLGVPEANLTLLTDQDATQGTFKGRLKRTLAKLGPDDTLYFYYAGHGAPSRDGKSAYLMPQDADETTFEEADLRIENLLAQLAASKARRLVVLLDACFSGRTGPRAMLFKGVAPVMITPTSPVTDPDRITLFTASEGNQFANEHRERSQRLFTWHLVDALLDGVRELGPLARRVREGVAQASRERGPVYEQTPALQGRQEGKL
ncbi:MAG: caspase family protein [Candidatus Sericytochromatia bacterium]|nr:caspase family protein [Candidatus Sericytochromatia bacterium]